MKWQMISKSFPRSVIQRKIKTFDGSYLDQGPEPDRSNGEYGDKM